MGCVRGCSSDPNELPASTTDFPDNLSRLYTVQPVWLSIFSLRSYVVVRMKFLPVVYVVTSKCCK